MSEYEAYWLTDFPLIIHWACQEIITYGDLKKKLISTFTVDKDYSYKN